MKLKNTILAAAAVCTFAAPAHAGDKEANAGTSTRKLLDPANMDKTVRPGDNFFMYANGAWLKANPIPSTETRWGSFNELQENNYTALHKLLEEAADTKAKPGSPEQKVGDLYRSGMNTDAIQAAGISPLKTVLARIDAIRDQDGLLKEIALEHTMGLTPLFNFYVAPDDKNVEMQIPQFGQGGLGLPDRDYYFKKDPRTSKIREAYIQYMVKLLDMMRYTNSAAAAQEVFRLETHMADASMTRVELRDPYKVYNKFRLDEIGTKTPGFDWKSLFVDMHIPKTEQNTLLVGQPAFFVQAGKLIKEIPLAVWKDYLKFHVVNDMAPYLSSNFEDLHFTFYGKTLRGQQEQKPRWKRVLNVVDGSVGELLGQMYVNRNFKPEAKTRMRALVDNLQATYAARIQRLDWMSSTTKEKALAKLNMFMKKIGYPDKWKNYDKLTITNNYVDNIFAASAFEYDYNMSKLGRSVDKTEWGMTPPTVNAYYNPAFNEIVFPAGILQYPFFDPSADDAVNYGGIGAVIGHEMTHGFDDQGRQYDASGNLQDWWTPEDAKKFNEKANVVVEQFNKYKVLDTVHVNGQLTLGENLADLGGLAIAYEAFKKTEQGKSGARVDGFTPDQRFFLSWAQVWRAGTRPEEMATRIMTDPHSPNEWRCNGPLSNIAEFYNAFDIKPSDKMYRPVNERAKVW